MGADEERGEGGRTPGLDASEVARFYERERVATMFRRGSVLRGLGRPRMAVLECAGRTVRLHDQDGSVLLEHDASSLEVSSTAAYLWLRAPQVRFRVEGADPTAVRLKNRPARLVQLLDRYETVDQVPGLGDGNRVLSYAAATVRKGVWARLWMGLLVQRGASKH